MSATTFTSTRVILRVWGFTAADAQAAEARARQTPRSYRWNIVEVIPSYGTPCPIPSHDPIAIDQAAGYDVAWAVYSANRT